VKEAIKLDTLPVDKPVAQNIYDNQNRLLLKQGAILTGSLIDRLKSTNIESVYVEKDESPEFALEPHSAISLAPPSELQALYRELYKEQIKIGLRGTYRKPVQKELPDKVKALINAIDDDLELALHFYMGIKKSQSQYRFEHHHINTCILTILLGFWLGLDVLLLKELGVVAMLHDIGELQLSSVINKPGRLTVAERERVKLHPTIGVEILNKTPWINSRELYGVYTHHERLNGYGYPKGILGDLIPIHARIVSVASIFNATTSNRSHQRAKNIVDTILELRNRSYGELDSRVTRTLFNHVADYLQRNKSSVILSNGDKGYLQRLSMDASKLVVIGQEIYDLDDYKCPKVVSVI